MTRAIPKFSAGIARRTRASAWLAWLLWPALAIAAIVTAADIANAIRNSPTASAFLKAHADEIGALSSRVEDRSGDTTVYNGSCCYGVLQLNTANILAAGYSVAEYRNGSLQQQVDGWSKTQSQALNDPVIARLAGLSTFDGQPVDASMLLACVQLGQGNCRKMINSGSCSGFADSNGTTTCQMAATTRAAINGTATTGGGGSTASGGSGSGGGGGVATGGGSYSPGSSVSSLPPKQAFEQGAGLPMSKVNESIKLMLAGFALIWLAWSTYGIWGQFVKGRMGVHMMASTVSRGLLVVMVVILLVN